MKTTKTNEREQLIAMWEQTGAKGTKYLTGEIYNKKCVGFFNRNKKNPKEPDIRVCLDNDEHTQLLSLWKTTSKKGLDYMYGLTNENEKIVAFYGKQGTKQPYIAVYESTPKEDK